MSRRPAPFNSQTLYAHDRPYVHHKSGAQVFRRTIDFPSCKTDFAKIVQFAAEALQMPLGDQMRTSSPMHKQLSQLAIACGIMQSFSTNCVKDAQAGQRCMLNNVQELAHKLLILSHLHDRYPNIQLSDLADAVKKVFNQASVLLTYRPRGEPGVLVRNPWLPDVLAQLQQLGLDPFPQRAAPAPLPPLPRPAAQAKAGAAAAAAAPRRKGPRRVKPLSEDYKDDADVAALISSDPSLIPTYKVQAALLRAQSSTQSPLDRFRAIQAEAYGAAEALSDEDDQFYGSSSSPPPPPSRPAHSTYMDPSLFDAPQPTERKRRVAAAAAAADANEGFFGPMAAAASSNRVRTTYVAPILFGNQQAYADDGLPENVGASYAAASITAPYVAAPKPGRVKSGSGKKWTMEDVEASLEAYVNARWGS